MKRPVPIMLLAADYAIYIFISLQSVSKAQQIPWMHNSSVYAYGYAGVIAVGCAALAYGLWTLQDWARLTAIFCQVATILSVVTALIGLGGTALISDKGLALIPKETSWLFLFGILKGVIALVYLRLPSVRAMFRSPTHEMVPDSALATHPLTWAVWMLCALGGPLVMHYQTSNLQGYQARMDKLLHPSLAELESKAKRPIPKNGLACSMT